MKTFSTYTTSSDDEYTGYKPNLPSQQQRQRGSSSRLLRVWWAEILCCVLVMAIRFDHQHSHRSVHSGPENKRSCSRMRGYQSTQMVVV
jgi:hypothetical protein